MTAADQLARSVRLPGRSVAGPAEHLPDGFYNLTRRHSALDYVSPIEFELNFEIDELSKMAA